MNLLNINKLSSQDNFRQRIRGAVLVVSAKIASEPQTTEDHKRRVLWAAQTSYSLDSTAQRVAFLAAVEFDSKNVDGSDNAIDDAEIINAVEVIASKLAAELPPQN